VALDAVGGPGPGYEPLGRDLLAAGLAQPKSAGFDALQSAFDLGEVNLFALTELLAALAFGYLGGGSRLSAVGDARVLDLLREFEPNSRSLGFERKSGVLNQLGVHDAHRTLLNGVLRADWA
jgi:hypothetical protein